MSQDAQIVEIDYDLLKIINEIHFTRREIDVISCLIHGRSTKIIACLLPIVAKTVDNHIHNVTTKINCNSRQGVLDFVIKSGKIQLLRQHYATLIIAEHFHKSLKAIARLIKTHEVGSFVIHGTNTPLQQTLICNLEKDFKILGISISVQQNKKKKTRVVSL